MADLFPPSWAVTPDAPWNPRIAAPRDFTANPLRPGESYSGPTSGYNVNLPGGSGGGTPVLSGSTISSPRVSALNTSNLFANSADSTPLASGFPILSQMIDYMLRSQAEKRAGIDQSVNIARLFADLERVSPTRAASMAASMGVKPNDSFSFANLFGSGANFPLAGGNRVRANIGGISTSLPSVLSGQELAFMNANPNVARVVQDVAEALGVPDLFSRSMAARIPGMSSIFAGGI